MRAALVLQGGPKYPDPRKVEKYKLTRLYWEARDPAVDAAFLDQMRTGSLPDRAPVEVGVMRDPGWTGSQPEDLADLMRGDVSRLGSDSKQLAVMADIETWQTPTLLQRWLAAWRRYRPLRSTLWTPGFHQGGWFTKDFVTTINYDVNLIVVPQAYIYDPPIPVDADLTRCDITGRGVARDRVGVFYLAGDVAHRESWDGIVFDFNALP